MTTQPTRAEWWREVTDPDEIIPKGCPMRTENGEDAREHRTSRGWARAEVLATRVFLDSRWAPPKSPKVGDIIETVEDLDRLPVGAGVVDYREEIARKRCEQRWNYANLSSESCGSESIMGLAPVTVIYLPKGGA
jgi:hypothetical protein